MLRDSVVVVVVRTRPRAIPLAMITMRKSTHRFPFVFYIWVAYGAPLGSPSGRRSSAIKKEIHNKSFSFIYSLSESDKNLTIHRSEKTRLISLFLSI